MKIKTKRGTRRIRNQRVINRRFVTTDYTGCPYITAGKRYEVSCDGESIIDDEGDTIELVSPYYDAPSCHLDGHYWQWGAI